jgi:CubicO group peptidase (beta-lactamase class C family)
MQMLFGVGDAGTFAANRPLAAKPGTVWQYSSATSNILARIVRHVLADDQVYLVFPSQALFGPLGMASAVMETDAAGTFIGSSYMYASARDWAR